MKENKKTKMQRDHDPALRSTVKTNLWERGWVNGGRRLIARRELVLIAEVVGSNSVGMPTLECEVAARVMEV
jgi:hypothetical protein